MPRYDEGPGLGTYLIRFVLVLTVLAVAGLVAYAYVGDLTRAPAPRSVPVTLGGG